MLDTWKVRNDESLESQVEESFGLLVEPAIEDFWNEMKYNNRNIEGKALCGMNRDIFSLNFYLT